MLEARPAKRDATNRFSRDARWGIFEADAPIGALVYDIKSESATMNVRGQAFTAARERKRQDEALGRMVLRILSGRAKPPPNPVLLKDASGAVLARSERKGDASLLVRRGDEAFELRRRSAFSRPHYLYRQGQSQALGMVGSKKIFTTRICIDLPSEFDEPFQVFMLALLTDLGFVRRADMST
ncbi:MAG: hypothetical protein ABSC22_14345 [Roseiarcus sp.]|jgi:hypothetical protein